ncbi:hypothetical protein BABINDRAFT_164199 [Babjeviella inositovora NRRL Y-12698]|uniref:Uncharacterized protein n=1 Tax=Babjeviella inositovora NRRL Y-12698 TaxID=984486 RepID=A0A1E3QXJ5_9ASCO|nr:uncharacterized protein BABINDRAFT_164199 [Babjeviella inositovora NRRL Y-12698]ODQ82399.1 hypothetical protein BABINDRAFT_164199 [Babjeviella inositovora NRRL Y-12698]
MSRFGSGHVQDASTSSDWVASPWNQPGMLPDNNDQWREKFTPENCLQSGLSKGALLVSAAVALIPPFSRAANPPSLSLPDVAALRLCTIFFLGNAWSLRATLNARLHGAETAAEAIEGKKAENTDEARAAHRQGR